MFIVGTINLSFQFVNAFLFFEAKPMKLIASSEVATPKTFRDFVDAVVAEKFEGVSMRLAGALGITPSALTRGVESGTLSTFNCLKLAAVAGVHPSTLLQLANKAETAALIEDLYGPPRDPMTNYDRRLMSLPMKTRKKLAEVLDEVRDLKPDTRPRGLD